MTKQTGLNERAEHLLKSLVERYIREGQPVGSRILARDARMDLSPATVRNVMADLEDLGLVQSPHTSAGRVPTVQGYRVFVDSLLTVRPLPDQEVEDLKRQLLAPDEDVNLVLESASGLLSEITRLAGVVMVPRREQVVLRQLEFLPLSENRILVILVVNEQEVQNRVIHTARSYSPAELQQMANYLNQQFAGRGLRQIREAVLKEMRADREDMNQLMQNAIEVASQAFTGEKEQSGDYVLAGHTNLMSYEEMADVNKLRQLFEAFNRKRDILHLLDQALEAEGVQIFIGEESGYEVLDECSVVTSSYHDEEGDFLGVLGVIGPTRMAYDRVIPIVDVAAKLVGAALNRGH